MKKIAGAQFERTLPSQHAQARETREAGNLKRQEAEQQEAARRRAAFDWLLNQENGRLVWAWLFNRCGWNKPMLLRVAGGDVAPLSTECVAAQREIYRELRALATPELLAKAEYEAEFGIAVKAEKEVKSTKVEKK